MDNYQIAFVIFFGGGLGSCLRWGLGLWLNPLFSSLPLGTLFANYLGCALAGVALGFFSLHTTLPAEIRLFVITGFLGGLTTFSTFSLEVVDCLWQDRMSLALFIIAMHLIGSLLLACLGLLVTRWLVSG